MLSLTFIIVFIFCLAIAIASILLSHQFITTYNTDFHRNYFYYLMAFFAFAFYGIWGQIIVRTLLKSMTTNVEIIEATANFLPVLGVPFLFISWIMLINMTYALLELKVKSSWFIVHFMLLLVLLIGIWRFYAFLDGDGQLVDEQLTYYEVGLLLLMELVYFLMCALILVYNIKKLQKSISKYIYRFLLLMVAGLVLRGCILPVSFISPWVLAPAILLYFASNFLPLFYLRNTADLIFMPIYAEHKSEEKMELIFKKHQISKREKEIVQHICEGKTNQQIADELFISLQTVKDHTHRIYTKIGIKSRMQLVQMVNA
jgi:DNA-binding CsgD family transcriptional regulator